MERLNSLYRPGRMLPRNRSFLRNKRRAPMCDIQVFKLVGAFGASIETGWRLKQASAIRA
jgi:hypothetical protein